MCVVSKVSIRYRINSAMALVSLRITHSAGVQHYHSAVRRVCVERYSEPSNLAHTSTSYHVSMDLWI
jgi:hypothetical protein